MPLRLRGLVLVALAAGAFGLGVARADLAGLFWGSSFLLAALYAGLGALGMRLALARKRAIEPAFLTVTLPPEGLRIGGEGEARVAAVLPRAFAPGFTVRLVVRPVWHDRSLGPITVALAPGKNRAAVPFRAARRGLYLALTAELEATDVLGIAHSTLPVPIRESVRVIPGAAPRRPPDRETGEGGLAPRYERHRRRSDELLEVRPYVPGDDVRRLNWKLLAHAGELFLRVGEETPPPRSRMLVVLDTSRPQAVPQGRADDLLDLLVEDCSSATLALLRRGVELVVTRPGGGRCETFSSEAGSALLAWFSEAWWSEPDAQLPLAAGGSSGNGDGSGRPGGGRPGGGVAPGGANGVASPRRAGRRVAPHSARVPIRALVFSTAGSTGLEGILAALRARRCRTTLLLTELPAKPRPPRRSLRDVLLVPGTSVERKFRQAR